MYARIRARLTLHLEMPTCATHNTRATHAHVHDRAREKSCPALVRVTTTRHTAAADVTRAPRRLPVDSCCCAARSRPGRRWWRAWHRGWSRLSASWLAVVASSEWIADCAATTDCACRSCPPPVPCGRRSPLGSATRKKEHALK